MTTRRRQSSICMTTMRKIANSSARSLLLLLSFSACFSSKPAIQAPSETSEGRGTLVRPPASGQTTSPHAAHGWGASTDGGTAGQVIRVTTLAANGEGSLRKALEAEGPRLVVFEVGGVIDLAGRTLTVRQPHLTLAGQT